jgi:hypothetical protein
MHTLWLPNYRFVLCLLSEYVFSAQFQSGHQGTALMSRAPIVGNPRMEIDMFELFCMARTGDLLLFHSKVRLPCHLSRL